MPSMPWVKLWTEILDDVKLAGLTDAQRWRFIQLILLAAECDAAGAIVTGDSRMTHTQVSWRLRCDEMTLESDIKKLIEVGLITEDGALIVTNFATRQGPTQEDKRKSWVERQKKHRERAKIGNVTGESRVTNADVTPLEEEEEREKEEEGESDFDTLAHFFETSTGCPIIPNEENVNAINGWVRDGITEDDIKDAVAYYSGNGRTARSPAQIDKSVRTALAKRVQAGAKAVPVKEPYASEVWG